MIKLTQITVMVVQYHSKSGNTEPSSGTPLCECPRSRDIISTFVSIILGNKDYHGLNS